MSVLYNTNAYDFTYTTDTVASPDSSLSLCDIPYGTTYRYLNGSLHLAGIYSYSSVSGGTGDDDLCNVNTARIYYMMISDWLLHILNGLREDGSRPARSMWSAPKDDDKLLLLKRLLIAADMEAAKRQRIGHAHAQP
ncbi:hypothetical protein EV175_002733 [Coemansia sp. RSA 1933]|nr:hypothetical protein EV175_002733 [Coemansia sp. RSA 1933]